jgi:hypothetical protein
VTIDPMNPSIGTMPPEPDVLEPAADHGGWTEARGVA